MNTESSKSGLALAAALSMILIHASGCSTHVAKSDGANGQDVAAAEGSARPESRISEDDEKMLKAAWNGRLMEVVTLLEEGVDPNVRSPHGVTPLSLAAQNNHLKIARKLLEKGADPNLEDKRAGWFPLMWASFNGFDEFVMLLIEHGADVNKRNAHNETAMLHAAFEGRDDTVRILLDHGADHTVENDKGFTAMKAAKNKGFYRIVEMISEQENQREGG
ncbi:hypothetical protein D6C00_13750 [Thiohalobacter thiocyanaticus]|uniref:Uncharacterized protein n=1 Tax=Thiohalobacter thiocyanaticus TaxID=585455 RepID=A0A426QMI8_9GAMM|nr:hypothetical protein D6C00_13750 [Thiohalobacter thiocyanaticus]